MDYRVVVSNVFAKHNDARYAPIVMRIIHIEGMKAFTRLAGVDFERYFIVLLIRIKSFVGSCIVNSVVTTRKITIAY